MYRLQRQVLNRSSDSLIRHVNAIFLDAGRAALATRYGNSSIAILGRVKTPAIQGLNARFELGQIQEIPPVHRQAIDLVGSYDAAHRAAVDFDRGFARDLWRD